MRIANPSVQGHRNDSISIAEYSVNAPHSMTNLRNVGRPNDVLIMRSSRDVMELKKMDMNKAAPAARSDTEIFCLGFFELRYTRWVMPELRVFHTAAPEINPSLKISAKVLPLVPRSIWPFHSFQLYPSDSVHGTECLLVG
nr:DNA replication ATP-dependent helicase/nuclease DNA2 [Ipomoea batatas]